MRLQKIENLNKALAFIKGRGVNLTNIGAEVDSYLTPGYRRWKRKARLGFDLDHHFTIFYRQH